MMCWCSHTQMLVVDKHHPSDMGLHLFSYHTNHYTALNLDKRSVSVDIIARILSPLTFFLLSGQQSTTVQRVFAIWATNSTYRNTYSFANYWQDSEHYARLIVLTFLQRWSENIFISKVSLTMNHMLISCKKGQVLSHLIKGINLTAALRTHVFWNCVSSFVFVLYSMGRGRQWGASRCQPQTLKTKHTACVRQFESTVRECWFHRQPLSNEIFISI